MKSNRNMVAAAVIGAVAMVGAASSANAAPASGQYANVQLGISDVTGYSSGSAIIGTLGFPMPQVSPYFSVEGELTKVLGKPSDNYNFFGNRYSSEVDYWTLAGYGVLTYPLNNQFSLRGRLGLLYENVTVDVSSPFGSASGSSTDTGLSFGFGATYKMSPTMNLMAEYTQIESDISHLSAGVQFRF